MLRNYFRKGFLPFYCEGDDGGGGTPDGGGGGGDTGFVGSDGVFSENWSQGESFKENTATLSRYKNVTDLANAHMELRNKFSKNPDSMVEIPGDNPSDEVKAAWRKVHNVPETIDGYEYVMPDELAAKLGAVDDNKIAAFREFADKKNWSAEDYRDVLDFYHTNLVADTDAVNISFQENQNAAAAEAKKLLQGKWLGEYDDRVNRSNAIMRKYGGEEAVAAFNAENSPVMAEFLDNIAGAMSESTLKGLGGSSGASADAIKSQINEIRGRQDKIREANPINFKSDSVFKELEGKLKALYQKKSA